MSSEDEENAHPAQLPMVPDRVRQAALAELNRLHTFVRALPVSDWSRPSEAEGWSIGDVVTHLALVMRYQSQVLGTATSSKPSGGLWKAVSDLTRTAGPTIGPAFHAASSAVTKLMDKTMTRENVLSQFDAGAKTLRERLETIAPADYSKYVTYFSGTWPVSFFLADIVNELAIHGWDIESALDPQARLDDDARSVLPWFYWSGTPFMLRPVGGTQGTIQAILSDPSLEMWWSLKAGSKEQFMGRTETPDVTITSDSGMYILALAGRIKPLEALRFGAIEVAGNKELGRAFLGGWHQVM